MNKTLIYCICEGKENILFFLPHSVTNYWMTKPSKKHFLSKKLDVTEVFKVEKMIIIIIF